MTATQLCEELRQTGYMNQVCETELAAARRVTDADRFKRRNHQVVDAGVLQQVLAQDLVHALELDRRQVFRAWYQQPNDDSQGVPLWQQQLQRAEQEYQAGRAPSVVHFILSHPAGASREEERR
jgi:hypothetical protein